MPHAILEYSSNVLDKIDQLSLKKINETMVSTGHFNIQDIKSRAISHDSFCVSNGESDQVFVHLQLAIKPRSDEIKKSVSNSLLEVVQEIFSTTATKKNCSFTVEIRELHGESYSKAVSGNL